MWKRLQSPSCLQTSQGKPADGLSRTGPASISPVRYAASSCSRSTHKLAAMPDAGYVCGASAVVLRLSPMPTEEPIAERVAPIPPWTDREKAREAGRKGAIARWHKQPPPPAATPQPSAPQPDQRDAILKRRIELALAAADSRNPEDMRDSDVIRLMADTLRDLASERGVSSDQAIRQAYDSPPTCPHCQRSLL